MAITKDQAKKYSNEKKSKSHILTEAVIDNYLIDHFNDNPEHKISLSLWALDAEFRKIVSHITLIPKNVFYQEIPEWYKSNGWTIEFDFAHESLIFS